MLTNNIEALASQLEKNACSDHMSHVTSHMSHVTCARIEKDMEMFQNYHLHVILSLDYLVF